MTSMLQELLTIIKIKDKGKAALLSLYSELYNEIAG